MNRSIKLVSLIDQNYDFLIIVKIMLKNKMENYDYFKK